MSTNQKKAPAAPVSIRLTKGAVTAFQRWDTSVTVTGPTLLRRFLATIGAVDESGAWLPDSDAATAGIRGIAVAVIRATDPALSGSWTGWERRVPGAKDRAGMTPEEGAYWDAVNRLDARLKWATKEVRPVVARAKREGSPATAKAEKAEKAAPAPAPAPAAPAADPAQPARLDAAQVASVIQQVAARKRVPGITRDGAAAIIAAAQATAPAPRITADAIPADTGREWLEAMVTSRYVSPSLLATAQAYCAMATLAQNASVAA